YGAAPKMTQMWFRFGILVSHSIYFPEHFLPLRSWQDFANWSDALNPKLFIPTVSIPILLLGGPRLDQQPFQLVPSVITSSETVKTQVEFWAGSTRAGLQLRSVTARPPKR